MSYSIYYIDVRYTIHGCFHKLEVLLVGVLSIRAPLFLGLD